MVTELLLWDRLQPVAAAPDSLKAVPTHEFGRAAMVTEVVLWDRLQPVATEADSLKAVPRHEFRRAAMVTPWA